MKKAKSKIDWSLTGCCSAKPERVAGILRCSRCGRETYVDDSGRDVVHMWDVHDYAFQRGFDDDPVNQ